MTRSISKGFGKPFSNAMAMSPIHDRMPAILSPQDYDEWLDRGEVERAPIHLLRPFPETTLQIHAANPRVGNVHNQDAALLDPQ
jgi:putative SOS response-associated peptidase YedK